MITIIFWETLSIDIILRSIDCYVQKLFLVVEEDVDVDPAGAPGPESGEQADPEEIQASMLFNPPCSSKF